MLFNSYVFPLFFAVVYALYIGLRQSFRAQNVLLLAASYACSTATGTGGSSSLLAALVAGRLTSSAALAVRAEREARGPPADAAWRTSIVVNLSGPSACSSTSTVSSCSPASRKRCA
jgi:hypothetical protein